MRRIQVVLLAGLTVVALAACNFKLSSSNDVADLDSSSYDPSSTAHFTMPGAWDLYMTYNCSKQQSERLAGINTFDMIVYNADDMSSNSEHPEVHLKGVKHTETLHFKRGTVVHISVDSRCDWRLRALDKSSSA